MGAHHSDLFAESTIPGLSTAFSSQSSSRRIMLLFVFFVLISLTFKDLVSIVTDYFSYPITVSVLVAESRVLPFPGVTICNSNPVHRGRFCAATHIHKPKEIEQILCATLTDLFQVCKITDSLKNLVEDGRAICEGRAGGNRTSGGGGGGRRGKKKPRKKKKPRGERHRNEGSQDVVKNMLADTILPSLAGIGGEEEEEEEEGTEERVAPSSSIGLVGSDLNNSVTHPSPTPKADTNGNRKSNGNGNPLGPLLSHIPGILDHLHPLGGETGVVLPGQWPPRDQPEDDDEQDPEEEAPGPEPEPKREPEPAKGGGRGLGVGAGLGEGIDPHRNILSGVIISRKGNDMKPTLKRVKRSRGGKGGGGGGDPELSLGSILKTFKAIKAGNFSGGLLQPFTEPGGILDSIIPQVTSFFGIHINSTRDLLPALFMRAFTQTTGCNVGGSNSDSTVVNEALDNLTSIFQATGCVWKAPKIIRLFQSSSKQLLHQLSTCTGPWVNGLLGINETHHPGKGGGKGGDDPEANSAWFILLEKLEQWLTDLSRTNPKEAVKLGHQGEDLIETCHFSGVKCDVNSDFTSTFHPEQGNCFTFLMKDDLDESSEGDSKHKGNHSNEGPLIGFTGPKFGLELMFNLEKDMYMPTSKEAGVKVILHDREEKADPDDSINISAGVVTYVGVEMSHLSRLPEPYPDRCRSQWDAEGDYIKWATSENHDTYTIQVCLKICLQLHTMERCGCWTASALWPPSTSMQECSSLGHAATQCAQVVRHDYYQEQVQCDCPPRCTDTIYGRFLSTGQETRQCSAISDQSPNSKKHSEGDADEPDPEEEPEQSQQEKEDEMANKGKVIIYFHSLSSHHITQDKRYTLEGLLGAIGGILGVYLGISFFAIFEMAELLFRGCCTRKGKGGSRRGRHSVSPQYDGHYGEKDVRSPRYRSKQYPPEPYYSREKERAGGGGGGKGHSDRRR